MHAAETARAQGTEQRAGLERMRDSLAQQSDSTALLAREQQLIARARLHRDSTLLHVELGFMAHWLGEITGVTRHYDDAASEFEWASELAPEWPYPWYGLGLAELSLGEHQVIALENLRQVLGQDYLSKAARALARATRADPTFALAVIDLAHTAMRQRVGARLDVARDALREAAATAAGSVPALQLARGRVERESGEGDSALAAFQRYLTVGGDSGVGLFEIARSHFYLRRTPEAIATYYAAADRPLSPDARALFRADLAWITTPAELAAFDSLDAGGAGRRWLERFWARRDADDGRRPGDRIAEHYRRYFYALRHYHLVSRHRHYDITERFRSEQDELDDRGVIYLRHGEPDRRATYSSPAVEPNESWQYLGGGASLVFHFVARDDVDDFKLVESLADAYGARVAITAAASGNASLTAGLFESRSAMDPLYQRLGGPGSYANRGSELARARSRGREAIHVGTTTDNYALRFARPLAPAVRDLVVGGRDGGATLLVPFALAGSALTAERRGESVVYPLAIRLAARGENGDVVVRDTVRAFGAPRSLDAREQLNGLATLDLPPGRYHVRMVVSQPNADAGSVIALDSLVVPALGTGAFALSDVLVGRRGEGVSWLAGADTIPLSATMTYPEGSSLEVYYEIHGIQTGERYRSRIEIARDGRGGFLGLFGGRRIPVSLAFEGAADGVPTRVRQTVNLGSLDPGKYRLSVSVENVSGDARHARPVSLTVTGKAP